MGTEEKKDQVLDLIGNIGKWQWILILLFAISGIPTSWQILVLTFLTPKADFICEPKIFPEGSGTTNRTYEEWIAIAKEILPENKTLSTCNVTIYNEIESEMVNINETCSKWIHDTSFYSSTLINEFDLVCGNSTYITAGQMIYFVGVLFGALISGMVSDKIGRTKTILVSTIGTIIFGTGAAFANSMVTFIALRFFVAAFTIALFTTGYCYCMELVGGRWRVIIGIGLEFPWAIGYSLLSPLAYLVPEWSYLNLVITLPLILFIGIALILPESPKWLLSQGKIEEAEDVLDRGMEINGKKFDDSMKLVSIQSQTEASILDLFKTPSLRKKTLIQYYLWFTCSMVYYGLTLNSGSLLPNGDLYINFLVGALIEFPAYVLTIVIILYSGRRFFVSSMMFLCGIFLFLFAFVPEGAPRLVTSTIGKFGVTSAFGSIYLYAAELYPTVVRNTGLGSSSTWARIGGILAPFVGGELVKYSFRLPVLIFAVFSLVAGFLTLLLPETKGKLLPDTIEEGEEFGKDDTIFSWYNKSKSRKPFKEGKENPAYT